MQFCAAYHQSPWAQLHSTILSSFRRRKRACKQNYNGVIYFNIIKCLSFKFSSYKSLQRSPEIFKILLQSMMGYGVHADNRRDRTWNQRVSYGRTWQEKFSRCCRMKLWQDYVHLEAVHLRQASDVSPRDDCIGPTEWRLAGAAGLRSGGDGEMVSRETINNRTTRWDGRASMSYHRENIVDDRRLGKPLRRPLPADRLFPMRRRPDDRRMYW